MVATCSTRYSLGANKFYKKKIKGKVNLRDRNVYRELLKETWGEKRAEMCGLNSMAKGRGLGRTFMCTVMNLDPKIRVFLGSYSVSTRKQLYLPNSVEIL